VNRLAARLAALTGWRRAAMAAALGAVGAAALPPVYFVPALVVAFVGLLWLIDGTPGVRAAFATGWWFGFGHFLAGLYWIANALMTDPARYGWLVAPAVLGVSAALAVYVALVAALVRLAPAGLGRTLALALAWAGAEWLRGILFTGFPWNLVAYSWAAWAAPMQAAALIGPFGLGLLTVLAAALPADLARGGRLGSVVAAALVALLISGGALRLAGATDATVAGVVLRLVQPNVAQNHKWRPKLREALFRRHLALSVGTGKATTVIWPETAVPFFLAEEPARRRAIAAVTPPGGLVITGTIRRELPAGGGVRLFNSVEAIDDRGAVVGVYDKAHLVPFGEYVPLRTLLPITKITAGTIDFSAGPGPRTLDLPGLPPVSPLICYEAIFPAGVVDPEKRPQWLLNVTNDAWFGTSSGPYQHFAAALMRTVEQGLPLARAANTGISAVVDAYGRIVARLGLGEGGAIEAPLPVALAPTPYARWGETAFAALLGLGVLAILGLAARRRG